MKDGGPARAPAIPRALRPLVVCCVAILCPWQGVGGQAPGSRAPEPDPVGIWNLAMRNLAERAVGGVQRELLRVEEVDGELRAEITAPNDRFLPVQGFRYEDGEMSVRFGVYEYDLRIDGDRVTGTMTSPVDTLDVTGARQSSLRYGGDEPEDWVTTRTGVLGHRTAGAPPEEEADPAVWVRSRVDSPGDFALVVRGHAVPFTNAESFADELRALAGRRVSVRIRWVGERLEIQGIVAAEDGERR